VLLVRLMPTAHHATASTLPLHFAPSLLAALATAGVLRWIARRAGFADGPVQSATILVAGLGAFELAMVVLGTPSHEIGVHGILNHGGWPSVLIALGAGAAVGLLACAAAVKIVGGLRPRTRTRVLSPAASPSACSSVVLPPRGAVLATHLAGRAPPVLSR
jgi:hypothetical protein